MSEGLEKLRSIGAQKIHEQTHIALKYVQALLHESFEGMQKVQLLGFISIMEREYGVDLTPLRESALEYFEMNESPLLDEEPSYKKELLSGSKKENKKLYILAALLVIVAIVGVLYFTQEEQESTTQAFKQEETQPAQIAVTQESNETNETNLTLPSPKENASKPTEVSHHSLTIIPRTKVWVGIIDLGNGKKRQTVTAQPLELNASKNYLLTFGHGYIDMEVDGNKTSYKDPQSIKFLYKEGTLKKIGVSEFKEYNKGRLW